jgi:hypothetical protein
MMPIELDGSVLKSSVAFTGRMACISRTEAFDVVRQHGGTRYENALADLLKRKEAGEKIEPAKEGPSPQVVNLKTQFTDTVLSQPGCGPAALHRRHSLVEQMLHEHAAALSAASRANRSRRLINVRKNLHATPSFHLQHALNKSCSFGQPACTRQACRLRHRVVHEPTFYAGLLIVRYVLGVSMRSVGQSGLHPGRSL